jgi:hypothetical protein
MTTFGTTEGTVAFPDALVGAVVLHSIHEADFAAGVLREMGLDRVRLPAAFLLEFAALMELWFWEWQGLRALLPESLPTFAAAKQPLCERALKGPKESEGPNATPLSHQILQTWPENFAWVARDQFGADVIVRHSDEDQLVDAVAQFLWDNRHQIECAVSGEDTGS